MFGNKSDEQLIGEALEGSERAWLALVTRYEKRLYNYALRMAGNPDDAKDMLQDILMAVFRNLSTFRQEAPFVAWLFRLAGFRCTDFLRRRRGNVTSLEDMDVMADTQESFAPDKSFTAASRNREVLNLMRRLSFDQRLVVELKFFQQFTFDEIGAQLGVSSNTAKTRLYSALAKMRREEEVPLAV